MGSVHNDELEVLDPRSVSSPLDALERGCCCWPLVLLALVAAAPVAEAPAASVAEAGTRDCEEEEESTWLRLLRLALTMRSYMFHVAYSYILVRSPRSTSKAADDDWPRWEGGIDSSCVRMGGAWQA